MRERYRRKVNVLGTEVSVMRVDKAVNTVMGLMRGKGVPVVYFLSAGRSLLCQNNEEAAEYVRSCEMVLPGDRHIEKALCHHQETENSNAGIGEFADDFLKHLFTKMSRTGRSIYAIMDTEEHLTSMNNYMSETYQGLEAEGSVLAGGTRGEADRIVNEINAAIPDIVFVCLSAEQQIKFMQEHKAMMNTSLCILIESIQPLIRKETREVPELVHALHMDGIYAWLQKEQKLQSTIIGSMFKKKVLDETVAEEQGFAAPRAEATSHDDPERREELCLSESEKEEIPQSEPERKGKPRMTEGRIEEELQGKSKNNTENNC